MVAEQKISSIIETYLIFFVELYCNHPYATVEDVTTMT